MSLRRWLPLLTFLVVFAAHAAWISRPVLKGCVTDSNGTSVPMAAEAPPTMCPTVAGFQQYVEEQDYYLSFSYALALAFTAFALGQWRRSRAGAVAGAVTGVSFTTFVVAFGCFVIGCCGSPMLPVWIALFGARGVGLAKPIVAGLTTRSLAVGYLLMQRKCCGAGCCGPSTSADEKCC